MGIYKIGKMSFRSINRPSTPAQDHIGHQGTTIQSTWYKIEAITKEFDIKAMSFKPIFENTVQSLRAFKSLEQ